MKVGGHSHSHGVHLEPVHVGARSKSAGFSDSHRISVGMGRLPPLQQLRTSESCEGLLPRLQDLNGQEGVGSAMLAHNPHVGINILPSSSRYIQSAPNVSRSVNLPPISNGGGGAAVSTASSVSAAVSAYKSKKLATRSTLVGGAS